jgi:hypothetical protein
MGSRSGRKFIQRRRSNCSLLTNRATLLRNVNLFLFVYVAEKVYQTTNKGDCCQPERDPARRVTTGGVRIGHKFIEIEDRTDDGRYANQYRKNIFQAFHFEPPASLFSMKVKEKAAFLSELWLHVNAGDEGMQVRCLVSCGAK